MKSRRVFVAAGLVLALALAGLTTWLVRRGHEVEAASPPGGSASEPPSGGSAQQGPLASPSPSGSGSAAPATVRRWRPEAGMTWQWQLSGTLDKGVDAQVYDVDAVETSAADVAALHAAGRKVICYVNAGAYEKWRPDAGKFPTAVLGKALDGWPDERWLDIRRWDLLKPIMTARFEMCRAKGFDAVEPDNIDGYANPSGFDLSANDQLTYNRQLAELSHRLGLAIGLKNDVEQAAALEPAFDFAVNEECMAYDECGTLRVFITAGKPVFHVEYKVDTAKFCAKARALGLSSMRKRPALDVWREPC